MKNNLLPRIIAASFLLQILMTWRLWFPVEGRTYPEVCLLSELDPRIFSLFSSVAVVLWLVFLILVPSHRGVAALLLWLAADCCLDLTRLQVWVWFYALIFVLWRAVGEFSILKKWLILLFAAVYFWGGLHKINPFFEQDIFPWLCGAGSFFQKFSTEKWLATGVAIFEMSLAAGILFPKIRRVFGWLAVGFHLANVLMLSPLGLNWNWVVIPWNLVMAVLIWWFCVSDPASTEPPESDPGIVERQVTAHWFFVFFDEKIFFQPLTVFVMLLAWLAPALNFAGWFPHNLSWKMYSGTHPEATFFFPKDLKIDAPPAVWQQVFGESENQLTLDDWSNFELGVPPFSTEFALKKAGRALCKKYGSAVDGTGIYLLTIRDVWRRDSEIVEKLDCESLQND